MRFTARPRMGGRRAVGRRCRGGPRRDRPLMGSRPRPPPEGEGGDEIGSCADIGCKVSVNKSMDYGCQCDQDSAEIIKNQGLQSCNDFAEFPWRKNATSCQEDHVASGSELGRALR